MSKQTESSLLMTSPLNVKYAELYQHLLKGFLTHEQLGRRLIFFAEQARAFRQLDRLSEIALVLSNMPVEHYRIIGQYYFALTVCRDGFGNMEQAHSLFEAVASVGPLKYKAEAMVSLSAVALVNKQSDETIRYCSEASKVGDLEATLKASWGIAALKGREGYHRSALRDLENLHTIARYAPTHIYLGYMNSLAVELSEVGRLQEAKSISDLLMRSPFAPYYPEWQDTFSEVSQRLYKSRSSTAVPAPKPQPKVGKLKVVAKPQAKVLPFPKRELPADDLISELSKFESVNLTPLQLLSLLLKVVLKERITDEETDRICNAYYQLIREYYAK